MVNDSYRSLTVCDEYLRKGNNSVKGREREREREREMVRKINKCALRALLLLAQGVCDCNDYASCNGCVSSKKTFLV